MQNKYAGDFGDYVKLALLRRIAPDRQLGVAWWLYPNEETKNDGRHTAYLSDPSKWKSLDPSLFDTLTNVVKLDRSLVGVSCLENGILDSAIFSSREIPSLYKVFRKRPALRSAWFEEVMDDLSNCDIVFVDPDNGLEPSRSKPMSAKWGKCITFEELRKLSRNRSVVVYHHQTRRKGGHEREIAYQSKRLRKLGLRVDAVRAMPYSPRVFFVLNADSEIQDRLRSFCTSWSGFVRLFTHEELEKLAE